MKRRPSRDQLTDAQISKILRYDLFVSACRIVEAGCSADQLPRFRQQRAKLAKKLGYNRNGLKFENQMLKAGSGK